MKILRVISSMNPKVGGPAQGIRNSIAAQLFHGIKNEVVCMDEVGDSYLGQDDFPIHALGRGKGGWGYSIELIRWLREHARSYDAVVVHGLWLFPSYAVWRVLGRSSGLDSSMPPYWIFPHGMLDPWFQKAPERRMKSIRNWFYWKMLESKVVHGARGLLFTCQEELRLARTTFRPYRPRREINVGYGIAAPPAQAQCMKTAFETHCPELEGREYLLFLSRLHPKKGVDMLIRAYGRMAKVQGEAFAVEKRQLPALLIAGPGLDTPYGASLQKLALEHCPAGSVLWPGMLQGDAKWGALYGCDAFILPSHQENFGIAVVESLACGKPVMISNQINIWREIKEAGGGLFGDDTDEGTFSMLERWVGMTPNEKERMSESATHCYMEKFRAEAVAKNFVEAVLQ